MTPAAKGAIAAAVVAACAWVLLAPRKHEDPGVTAETTLRALAARAAPCTWDAELEYTDVVATCALPLPPEGTTAFVYKSVVRDGRTIYVARVAPAHAAILPKDAWIAAAGGKPIHCHSAFTGMDDPDPTCVAVREHWRTP